MPRSTTSVTVTVLTPFALAAALALSGCGRPAADAPPPAPPAVPVGITTLAATPVDRSSDFIATIQSLSSTTVQPEVDGVVTRILVRAGDRVRRGTPLVQISADRQAAAVRSAEASREGTQADVRYWRQQVQRFQALLEAGAISRQEFEQAQTSLDTAEARLGALDAQVREGQVQLAYYQVAARQDGMIGDIPVRVGDRVTTSTVITTIDAPSDLEAHIQVPLDRAPELSLGLPVQLLDASGAVIATNPITFIAPRVDDGTQTVLVTSRLREIPADTRVRQFVRTRIVWATRRAVTAPVTAITRISGQYFAFVAEPGPQGGLVARQKPVEVGEVVGNDYVIERGLAAGDRLIVSGIQKIGDGAAVQQEPS